MFPYSRPMIMRRVVRCSVLAFWLIAFFCAPCNSEVLVVFRYDDYSATSPIEVDRSVINAFASRRMALTVGVIPYVCEGDIHDPMPQKTLSMDGEKAALLRASVRNGTVDAAVHGYSHQNRLRSPVGHFTEFAGLSIEHQRRRMAEAKSEVERLAGGLVETFIPPWDSFDKQTLRAAEAEGFRCFSASAAGPDMRRTRLRTVPVTTGLIGVRNAIEEARRQHNGRPIVGVLFHYYELRESGDARAVMSLEDFERLLEWISGQREVQVVTISRLLDQAVDLSPSRWAANAPVAWVPPLLRTLIQSSDSSGVWREQTEASRARLAVIGFGAFLYLAAFLAGFLSAWAVRRRLPALRGVVIAGSLLTSAFIFLRAAYYWCLGANSMLFLAALAGIVVGSAALHLTKRQGVAF